jgi:hypothetical protein
MGYLPQNDAVEEDVKDALRNLWAFGLIYFGVLMLYPQPRRWIRRLLFVVWSIALFLSGYLSGG